MHANLKKKYGQNFLFDKNILKNIVNIANLTNKNIIEIGPGSGYLTEFIIQKKPSKLTLVEIDEDLIENLHLRFSNYKHVKIIKLDFLQGEDILNSQVDIIISNLPYNVASQILIKISISESRPKLMILMFQKEFADKLIEEKLNSLNTIIKCFYIITRKFNVSKNSFKPSPKVNSSVLEFRKLDEALLNQNEIEKFILFKRDLFNKKRKYIRNTLKNHEKNKLIDFNLKRRPEDLNISELINIFRKINS